MAEVMKVEIVGLSEALATLGAADGRAIPELAQALHEEVTAVFNESQVQVPVDTGTLRSSGQVEMPSIEGTTVSCVAGYGGAASEYALTVHENLDAYHTPPTKAKYLEDPARAAVDSGMGARIAERVLALYRGHHSGLP